MSDVVKSIVAWTLICVGAGTTAVFSHSFFLQRTTAHETIGLRTTVQRMFVPGVSIREAPCKNQLPSSYWIVKKDSVTVGYAFMRESRVRGGAINFMTVIDTAGTIMGIKVVRERSIPGQGLLLEDRFMPGSLWRRMCGKTDSGRLWSIDLFTGTAATESMRAIAREIQKNAASFLHTIRQCEQ